MTLMSVGPLPWLCVNQLFHFPGWMKEWRFFYLSQSGATHSLSWWCRNTARTGEVTQAKMERFCCLFLSQYVVVFHSCETNIIRESLNFVWKEIYWSNNFTPVFRCSAEISHICWRAINEVLWHIWDACMLFCLTSCAHNLEQLAACKGSESQYWQHLPSDGWCLVCQFPVNTATKALGEELYLIQLQ